jgi:membrane-associated phospholipid phosphatase
VLLVSIQVSFALLTAVVAIVGRTGWETSVLREAQGWPDGLKFVLRPAMEFGNRAVAIALCLLVLWRCGRAAAIRLFGSAFFAWLIALVFKVSIRRPRLTVEEIGATPRHVVDGWSYPSGHTSIGWALATAAILIWRPSRPAAIAALVLATLSGLARIYVGVHMPLDVVGGALVGSGAALTVDLAYGRFRSKAD